MRSAPTFEAPWPSVASFFEGVDFLAAHDAVFDARVVRACCAWYGLPFPTRAFECTVRVARRSWNLRPTTLKHVADYLGLPLRHHDAASDAEVCAGIVLRAAGATTPGEPWRATPDIS